MKFFKILKLMPTAFKAMRAAKKQGLSGEEARAHVLKKVMLKTSNNDTEFVETVFSDLSEDDLSDTVPEQCIEVWNEFDPFEDLLSDEKEGEKWAFTSVHKEMLRRLRFAFDYTEAGVPMIDGLRVYGGRDLFQDLEEMSSKTERDELAELHTDLFYAIWIFTKYAKIEPGSYQLTHLEDEDFQNLLKSDLGQQWTIDEAGRFELTNEHIVAVRLLTWGWPDEDDIEDGLYNNVWPAPKTDGKRPYGAFTCFEIELALALGWEVEKDEEGYGKISPEQDQKLNAIHSDLYCAIQIFFENADLEEGEYSFT